MAKHKYISQDAAIDAVDVCNLHRGIIDALQAIISDIPTADVRPVVLCRDCVYYNTTGCADGFGWCEGVMVSKGTSDDFFCAEGKQNPYECGADMRPNLDTTKGDDHD